MCLDVTEIYAHCMHSANFPKTCWRRSGDIVGPDLGPEAKPPHNVIFTNVLKKSLCPVCVDCGGSILAIWPGLEQNGEVSNEANPAEKHCERDEAKIITHVSYKDTLYNVGRFEDPLDALVAVENHLIKRFQAFEHRAFDLPSLQEGTYSVGLRQHERLLYLSQWFSKRTHNATAMIDDLERMIDECRQNDWLMKLQIGHNTYFCRWW